jgi:hypothetical protein
MVAVFLTLFTSEVFSYLPSSITLSTFVVKAVETVLRAGNTCVIFIKVVSFVAGVTCFCVLADSTTFVACGAYGVDVEVGETTRNDTDSIYIYE